MAVESTLGFYGLKENLYCIYVSYAAKPQRTLSHCDVIRQLVWNFSKMLKLNKWKAGPWIEMSPKELSQTLWHVVHCTHAPNNPEPAISLYRNGTHSHRNGNSQAGTMAFYEAVFLFNGSMSTKQRSKNTVRVLTLKSISGPSLPSLYNFTTVLFTSDNIFIEALISVWEFFLFKLKLHDEKTCCGASTCWVTVWVI